MSEKAADLQKAARRGMFAAVRDSEFPAQDVNEAWEQLIAVQTEIALDGSGGAKATGAAKFVAGAAGLPLSEVEADPVILNLSEAEAVAFLAWVKREARSNAKTP